jgi:hypothetical protein
MPRRREQRPPVFDTIPMKCALGCYSMMALFLFVMTGVWTAGVAALVLLHLICRKW